MKNKRRWHFKIMIFFFLICSQLMGQPLIQLLHLFNLLQIQNESRMVNVESFDNFSCSFKRISFDDCSQLVTVNFPWLATVLLIFKDLISFLKLLEPLLPFTFISSSWAKCVDVASWPCSFMTYFELKLKKKQKTQFSFCLTPVP